MANKKKTTMLHEILAVEADRQGTAKRIMEETMHVFSSKHNLFAGMRRKLSMDTEGHESLEKAAEVNQEIETTVIDRLAYTEKYVNSWLDTTFIKEASNQNAKADLVVNGKTLIKDAPATFLLGLETKLKEIRKYYECAPTLQPGVKWVPDTNAANELSNTYITAETEVKSKTQKVRKYHTMAEATKEHPAQVDITNEEIVVGQFKTDMISGMIPANNKAKFIENINLLISATKQARQRANSTPIVSSSNVGSTLFDFIHNI